MVDILGVAGLDIVQDAGLDDEDLSQLPSSNKYKYVQTTVKGVERQFTLFDNIYLNYCLENVRPKGFKEKQFKDKSVALCTTNLTYIDSKPQNKRYFAWGWFLVALMALAAAFSISEYNTFAFKNYISQWQVSHDLLRKGSIGLAIFGVVALIVSFIRTRSESIYKTYAGRVPVFCVRNYPREKSFKDFIKLLDHCIYKAHNRRGITMNYRLVGEVKLLRKMNESGIVSSADYEKARKTIFSHKDYS